MSEDNKVKTPEQYAEKEMNQKIGKAIAKRQIQIKKLQEEVRKLKSGEMMPDADDNESSHHNQKEEIKEVVREIEKRVPYPVPVRIPDWEPRPWYPKPKPYRPDFPQKPWKSKPLWIYRTVSNYKSC
jgi:hypothetical protein